MTDEREPQVAIVKAEVDLNSLTATERYKIHRAQMIEVCEQISGENNPHARHSALEFMTRYEKAIRACALITAPTTEAAKQGFEAAAEAFLQEPERKA